MVSAACPTCNILLVEADDNGFDNLAAAVDEDANLGANATSNSYGGDEFGGETSYEGYYDHSDIPSTSSSSKNETPHGGRMVESNNIWRSFGQSL